MSREYARTRRLGLISLAWGVVGILILPVVGLLTLAARALLEQALGTPALVWALGPVIILVVVGALYGPGLLIASRARRLGVAGHDFSKEPRVLPAGELFQRGRGGLWWGYAAYVVMLFATVAAVGLAIVAYYFLHK